VEGPGGDRCSPDIIFVRDHPCLPSAVVSLIPRKFSRVFMQRHHKQGRDLRAALDRPVLGQKGSQSGPCPSTEKVFQLSRALKDPRKTWSLLPAPGPALSLSRRGLFAQARPLQQGRTVQGQDNDCLLDRPCPFPSQETFTELVRGWA
jgi:hypothetical protein